jgi:hypothetical protein
MHKVHFIAAAAARHHRLAIACLGTVESARVTAQLLTPAPFRGS